MADEVVIEVLYDRFPQIAAALPHVASQLVRKAAFDIQAFAASMAPVQYGFLKSSIYVVTHESSTYGMGVVSSPNPDASLLDEVERPESPTEAIVAVGANYGVYQEMGTVNMAAHPYLTPAAEAVRPAFIASMESMEMWLRALVGGL